MKPWWKKMGIIACCILCAGVVLSGIGWALGGKIVTLGDSLPDHSAAAVQRVFDRLEDFVHLDILDWVDDEVQDSLQQAREDVENAMKGLFKPVFREVELGRAAVRSTFKVSGVGTIAGSYVQDGKLTRNAQVRVVRDGIVIHEGKIASLKRFKDDVREVATGFECGVGIENFNDLQEGDVIEAFVMEEVQR